VKQSPYIPVDPRSCAASEVSAPYWEGLADGQLRLPRCDSCGEAFFFPRRWCPQCWSENISWFESSGQGAIYACCAINVPFDGRPADEVPYAVALVDLDDGIRLPGRLHPDAVDAEVGTRVAIEFGPDPGSTLPVWVISE